MLGDQLGDLTEQRVDAGVVLGGNERERPDAELVELVESLLRRFGIAFVDDENRGTVETPQRLPDALVRGDETVLAVDHEKQKITLFDGEEYLLVEAEGIVVGY